MPPSEDSAKPVVIHVPKTGGTTLIMASTRGKMQPKADEHYRHVLWNEDRTITHSHCGDLFGPDGAERYTGRKVMLTLRTPIDRLESEYHFLGNREEYRTLWTRHNQTTFPATFAEFVAADGSAESITKFLLGRDLYDGLRRAGGRRDDVDARGAARAPVGALHGAELLLDRPVRVLEHLPRHQAPLVHPPDQIVHVVLLPHTLLRGWERWA